MKVTKYKLTDVCDFQGGSQPPKKEWSKNKEDGFVRMLQIRDFTQREKNNIEYVKESNRLKKCKTDDVLIGRYGASIGKILTGLEGAYNVAIMKAIPNEKLLNNQYLLALLRGPIFQNFIQNIGGRAAQAGFNKEDLSKFNLSLPSLDNQKRIAQVLSNCESLIQKRKESIALLDELLKSTFLEMFGKRKGDEALLGDEIDIQTGLVNPNELPYSEMFHVGGRNIESNTGKISNLIRAKGENLISGKYLFEEGYLLYSKIRPNLNKVAVVDFTGICSADVYPIKPKNDKRLNIHFLRYELMAQRFLTYAINNSGRANIPKINRKTLNAYNLVLPSIELQNQFAKIVMQTETIRLKYESHLQELENLYGSISQKAFKGELDLSEAEVLNSVNYPDLINTSPYSLKDITEVKEKQDNSINKLTDLIEIDKVLDEIVKNDLKKELFSIDKILEILKRKNINIEVDLIKDYLKNSMNHNRIGQEFSGSTKQVMFKFKK